MLVSFIFHRSLRRKSSRFLIGFLLAFLVQATVVTAGAAISPDSPASSVISGLDLVKGQPNEVDFKQSKVATVLVFLSIKCPCSDRHREMLNDLARRFEPLGFKFVGIHSNADEKVDPSREYFRKSNLIFPVLQDTDARIADRFKAYKTPHAFVVSPKLGILYQGGVGDSKDVKKISQHYLREALLEIQNGKEPIHKKVRALGCEIRRP